MSKAAEEKIRLKHIEKYFKKSDGFLIYTIGKSIIIAGPQPPGRLRPMVRVLGGSSFTRNSEICNAVLDSIEKHFGVTRKDMLANY